MKEFRRELLKRGLLNSNKALAVALGRQLPSAAAVVARGRRKGKRHRTPQPLPLPLARRAAAAAATPAAVTVTAAAGGSAAVQSLRRRLSIFPFLLPRRRPLHRT